jgi:hypothetical protein
LPLILPVTYVLGWSFVLMNVVSLIDVSLESETVLGNTFSRLSLFASFYLKRDENTLLLHMEVNVLAKDHADSRLLRSLNAISNGFLFNSVVQVLSIVLAFVFMVLAFVFI